MQLQLTPNELHLLQALLLALGIGLYQARTIWRLVRERNYCRELLIREQRSHMQKQSETLRNAIVRQNEMLKILARAYASGEPTTLDDLLQNAEDDWSLRSSRTPSED